MDILAGETKVGHYLFLEQIGSGTFASVWLATHELIQMKLAIKVIQKSSILDDDSITRLTRELTFLKQMRHPFIVEFYEFLEDDFAFYYCMEYAENSSLLHHVLTNGPLSENQARHYFSQLISVLEYLHTDLRVCHRDVKSENVLLDRHNNIRVIDFGLSNQFTSTRPLLKTACGSPPYAPPEMICGHPYTQRADIWSAGVLLYAIVTGSLPFHDDSLQVLLTSIVTQDVVYPSFLSPPIVDLLRRILMKNPDYRITLEQIREHEWFSQARYSVLFAMQLGERANEHIVDAAIVDRMRQLGVETQHLKQQLLIGEFTELTAIYRMLRRDWLTDQMALRLAQWAEAPRIKPCRSGGGGAGNQVSDFPRPVLPILKPKARIRRKIGYSPGPRTRSRFSCPVRADSGDEAGPVISQRLERPVTRCRASSPMNSRVVSAFEDCEELDI